MIQRWWPSTQCLDLVEGSVESVAAAVHSEVSRFVKGEPLTAYWRAHPSLDDAFRETHEFTNVPTVFLVLPTRTKWSVLWNNSFLCDGYDSLCWCLTSNHGLTTLHWSAHDEWTSMQSGAMFHYRRRDGERLVERRVQAAQEDKRWHFFADGEPLPEEDLETYKDRRKRDRLNEAKMLEFLSRLGATPWQEDYYALPPARAFVLRREDRPSAIVGREIIDVIGES